MNNYIRLCVIIMTLFSCNSKEKVNKVFNDGTLVKETFNKSDHDSIATFYESGNLKESYTSIDDLKDGQYISFYDSSKSLVAIKCQYSEGLIDGVYSNYFKSGIFNAHFVYDKGALVKKVFFNNDNVYDTVAIILCKSKLITYINNKPRSNNRQK